MFTPITISKLSASRIKVNREQNLTPKEIVAHLDKYIIGQEQAKKSIALALRNRYRRMSLESNLKDEIMPKNILMIGQTGVGKTEIARRMAKMFSLPFVKIEVSKFTEVGFVGRDVESMVRDLAQASFEIVKKESEAGSTEDIENYIYDKIAKTLIPPIPSSATPEKQDDYGKSIHNMKQKIKDGTLDNNKISLEIQKKPTEFANKNMPQDLSNMQEAISKMLFNNKKETITREVTIKEAKELLRVEASSSVIDEADIASEALARAEHGGIIFVDEIDKIVASSSNRSDPSKEGVQRDLLPIVEGSSVYTKYGQMQTDHILFIAAGAFHISKPSDLIAELQGRFPIRVELEPLSEEILYQILTMTQNSLLTQYEALLAVDKVKIKFEDEAIRAIAKLAQMANEKADNIGARRLHTVIEKVLEDVSFDFEKHQKKKCTITAKLVHEKLDNLVEDEDTTRYIL